MRIARSISWIILTGMLTFHAGLVYSQDFPTRPIRILTSKLGSGGDILARLIAQGISGPIGQQVIVDNRANLVEIVMRSPPDGYNMLIDGISLWIEPLLRKTPWDMTRDFSPVTPVIRQTNILAVTPSLPVKSVKELIALAKAKPGELNYSMGGVGGLGFLATNLFKTTAGINIVQVNYSSGGTEMADLMAGQVQMAFGNTATTMQLVKSGKLRALAVTSIGPSALAPGVPPVTETLPGYEAVGVQAVYAAAKTPEAIIKRLNQEMVRFLVTAEAKEKLSALGVEGMTSSPEELAARIKTETAKWAKVIKDAGIRAE